MSETGALAVAFKDLGRSPSFLSNEKFIYFFSSKHTEGDAQMRDLLGGKGSGLAELCKLGVPVPPGFTISTQVCSAFYKAQESLPNEFWQQVEVAIAALEQELGKNFGDPQNPLLVSVRSGARASMPGMMDTILNLGLNDEVVLGLAKTTDKPRFAWDAYRRFIQMFSNVVLDINPSYFEVQIEDLKASRNITQDTELSVEDLKSLVQQFKFTVQQAGQNFPQDPREQLRLAVEAVFRSWNSARAKTYRELHQIPESWGTAVNVQSMVFGNLGEDSGTGVLFTRNPSTGERVVFGEFLMNAQGEDVVAGIRTPKPLEELKQILPKVHNELMEVCQKVETHFRDMQDIEFTIEKEKLWILQTRNGKRAARAALQIASDLLYEGLINEKEAILRIDPMALDQLLHPNLDPKAPRTLLTKGLPASPGGVSGKIVLSSEKAVALKELGEPLILVRDETSPEDIGGMAASRGILTARGGMTSHAAVVARGMGKCCVVGAGEVHIDEHQGFIKLRGYVLKEGDWITLEGSTGEVFLGVIPTVEPEFSGALADLMKRADPYRKLKVRANADTPHDAEVALSFGAEGIGLCRTEHMFFGADRIDVVRAMILAEVTSEREEALSKLLPMQRQDFYQIFKVMKDRPVTIRFLDPPLHEFLPHSEREVKELALRLQVDPLKLQARVKALHEFNPMLGHRGSRLAITFPEIYAMQARAVAEAAAQIFKEGERPAVEIMLPLIAFAEELEVLRRQVVEIVEGIRAASGQHFSYTVGTMIELPRAAIVADQIAKHADFFSFGTNDLTQTTLGLSRDDSSRFLPSYLAHGVISRDPFVSLDVEGVGSLVKLAVDRAKASKSDFKAGICGEHGGDPDSIRFFHQVGLDYVSCSPYRVPIARLAAAQAALRS